MKTYMQKCIAWCTAFSLICCSVVINPTSLSATESEGPVLLIVDRSLSMRDNDKRNFCIDCVQLALATVRHGRALNVVGFSNTAKSLLPWRDITDLDERCMVRDQDVGDTLPYMKGGTSYRAALSLAFKELNRISAAPGTRIIFFTDGETRDSASDVIAEAKRFQARGWIVDGLNLHTGVEHTRHDLKEICSLTGGNYIEVRQAEDLVSRFNQLSTRENDYFSLEVDEILPDSVITVPPSAESLIWITAKQENGNGGFTSLECDGKALDLNARQNYTYPSRLDRPSNLQLLNIQRPESGNYRAYYNGDPRSVFVSISLGIVASPIPVPALVKEYETIQLGLRVLPLEEDNALLDELAKRSTVTAIIHDEHGNFVSKTPLSVEKKGSALIYSAPYSVKWPSIDPKDHVGTHTIDYDFAVDDKWHLHKFDTFKVEPQDKRPSPTMSWNPDAVSLPPTWTNVETSGIVPFMAGGYLPPKTTLSLPVSDGFRFSSPVPMTTEKNGVKVSFQSATAGRFQTTVTGKISVDGREDEAPSLSVSADVYQWKGQSEIALSSAAGVSFANWIGVPAGLPEQPLQAVDIELSDSAGQKGIMHIRADGTVALDIPVTARSGLLQGKTQLQYGALPAKPLSIRCNYTPPQLDLSWQTPDTVHRLPSAASEWVSVPDQQVIQQTGLPGTVRLEVSDFTGPGGDILSADYDIRASLSPEQMGPGTSANVKLHIFRGEDISSGTYSGTVKMIHTAENGSEGVVELPMSITLEGAK